ncbi:carbonic anhydrase 15-like [Trichechus manatus latirostris]|uniref:carbonic anhydrase n=1 Tax=Trichechus manatus latirostris TaxID=127582 RepID=A0A2Y9G405_TRIMA|nr:carbonic anhydrase 15-like [Trichechus manatus latirostris]
MAAWRMVRKRQRSLPARSVAPDPASAFLVGVLPAPHIGPSGSRSSAPGLTTPLAHPTPAHDCSRVAASVVLHWLRATAGSCGATAAASTMWAAGFVFPFLAVRLVAHTDSEGAWCYDSQDPKCGPTHWKEIAPACGGPAQSPINIDLHLVQRDPTLGPFIFQGYNSAPPGRWTLENDGHTVLLHVGTDPQSHLEMRGAGLPPPAYRALQLHFHWGAPARAGSEHSLDGERRPMEMHVVHKNTRYRSLQEALGHPYGLAVLAVLLAEQDTDNVNFSVLVSGLKNVSGQGLSAELASTFPLASVPPGAAGLARYYRYPGSLTTPGCEPAVLWTVFEDSVPIGRQQVAQFQTVLQAWAPGSRPVQLTENFRPQQPLGGRRVTASPSASARAAAPLAAPAHVLAVPLGLGISQRLLQGL